MSLTGTFFGLYNLCCTDFLLLVGVEDKVVCFCCNGGLAVWQPEDDPWEEHAKYFPG